MNETIQIYLQIFTRVFLGIAFLSFASSSISITGQCLPLIAHPLMVRIRFFAFGLIFALWSQDYDWRKPAGIGFLTATLLLISAIRIRKRPATPHQTLNGENSGLR